MVRVAGPSTPRRVAGVAEREVVLVESPPLDDMSAVERLLGALSGQRCPAKWVVWPGPGRRCAAILPIEDLHDRGGLARAIDDVLPGAEVSFGKRAVSLVGTGLDEECALLDRVIATCDELDVVPSYLERTSLRLTVVVDETSSSALVRALHGLL